MGKQLRNPGGESDVLLFDAQRRMAEVEAIFAAQNQVVLIYDTDMNVVRANPHFARTYGFDPAGLNVREMIQRVSCRRLDGQPIIFEEQPTPRALRGERVSGTLFAVKRADGSDAVVETSSGPILLEGRIVGSVTVWHDATARARAEEVLHQTHEKVQAILDSIMDGVIVLDTAWRCTHFSETGARILNTRREDVEGARAWELLPHIGDTMFCECCFRALKMGMPERFEDYFPEPTGKWLECHCFPSPEGLSVHFRDITERRRSGEAVEQARAEAEIEKLMLEAVMEALPIGIAITDIRGGNVRSNREYDLIWGGPRPVPRSVEDYDAYKAWWADSGRRLDASEWASARAVQEGRTVTGQMLELQRFDGSHCYVINSASPVHDADGNIIGSAVAIQDITDLRKTQDALRESERLYRAIGETINYGVWVCDPDGRNIYASESFLNLVGMTQEQCSNFGWGDVLHPDDAERTIAEWKECVQTGGTWDIEHRFRGVDGKWHDVLARGVPVRNEQGEITCWAGINLDISRLKSAQEDIKCLNAQLDARERRLRLALEAGNMGIWDWEIVTGKLAWNHEHYRMLGYEAMAFEPSYDSWASRVHPEDLERAETELQAALSEESGFRVEFRTRWPDGTVRWLWTLGRSEHNVAGQAVRAYGVLIDITGIKETELQIRELNESLTRHVAAVNEANRELESYSHSVSHDLRTPLRFVNRIAHQLLEDARTVLSDEALQHVNLILQASSEMERLIEDLLAFSQLVRQPMRRQSVDLRQLSQEVWKEHEASRDPASSEEGRRISVVFNEVPKCVGDRRLLRQVVSNLLSNAFKFSRHRDPARIILGSKSVNGATVYFVEDNGVGFDVGKAGLLFRPFSRLHRSGGFEGTGIGLALVRRIIERHGGRVWAEGQVDKGAIFYFTLEDGDV